MLLSPAPAGPYPVPPSAERASRLWRSQKALQLGPGPPWCQLLQSQLERGVLTPRGEGGLLGA